MPPSRWTFTSESVSEGHPDKLSDAISDAVLDACLERDPNARVACETLCSTNILVLAGEIGLATGVEAPDYEAIARETAVRIGYDAADKGLDGRTCEVQIRLDTQSADIARGVDTGGAGDQGLMFGYACRETEQLMPLPIDLSHALVRRQAEVRRAGTIPHLRPDAKSQVAVTYEDGRPLHVENVVLSTQHGPEWSGDAQAELRRLVRTEIIQPVLEQYGVWRDDIECHINPTGQFELGGPHGDCGLTGRKIIVDTYGGMGRHGGGAFSGKDATKVDRSAAYMARYVAKNLVEAGLAERCEVQLAYAIGVKDPTSIKVDTFGTAINTNDAALEEAIRSVFDLTPKGIIDALKLRNPIYSPTTSGGHFGRTPGEGVDGSFPWEVTDQTDALKEAVHAAAGVC